MSLPADPQQREERLFSSPEISVIDYRCRVAHPVAGGDDCTTVLLGLRARDLEER